MTDHRLIELEGKTRVGLNHVRSRGGRWRVRDVRDAIACRDGKPGPWLLLESQDDVEAGKGRDAFLLWCHELSDPDHRIVSG